jgi:hypothetical protein
MVTFEKCPSAQFLNLERGPGLEILQSSVTGWHLTQHVRFGNVLTWQGCRGLQNDAGPRHKGALNIGFVLNDVARIIRLPGSGIM